MPDGPHNTHKFRIGSHLVPLDREAAYAIAIAMSEMHSRRCQQIWMCGDMEESTEAASSLVEIAKAFNEINYICADIDGIQPVPINL